MINTFSDTWKPRTGLPQTIAKSTKTEPRENDDSWDYTRGIIIRVLGTFPEAMQAVRDALREARRTGPQELYDPV
jgi:hypothetical protein